MSISRVTLVVRLTVKTHLLSEFESKFKTLMQHSRQEKGCVLYQMSKNIESENDFIIYEIFENETAFEHHTSSTHYNEFMSEIPEFLALEPIIEKY